ncbi:MAG: PilZ domain-containing protein [Candidatus Parcubacteria bacterium]|nr:PilZ domain-containing protein [Candidatus Parcubacteria bacterium]
MTDSEKEKNLPVAVDNRKSVRKSVPSEFPILVDHTGVLYQRKEELVKSVPSTVSSHVLSSHEVQCRIHDISEHGISIMSRLNLVKGQKVGIFFQIPAGICGEKLQGLTLICEVKYHHEDGAERGLWNLTGMYIESCTDWAVFKLFLKELPSIPQAHS